jgi:hypothetical protein
VTAPNLNQQAISAAFEALGEDYEPLRSLIADTIAAELQEPALGDGAPGLPLRPESRARRQEWALWHLVAVGGAAYTDEMDAAIFAAARVLAGEG